MDQQFINPQIFRSPTGKTGVNMYELQTALIRAERAVLADVKDTNAAFRQIQLDEEERTLNAVKLAEIAAQSQNHTEGQGENTAATCADSEA